MRVLVLWTALCCIEQPFFVNSSPLTFTDQIPNNTSHKDMIPGSCDMCLTKGCVTASHEVLSKMDFNVDPCDNFYEFACGNFLKETTIPDDKTSVNLYGQTTEKLNAELRSLLEEPSLPGEARPYTMAKTIYKSCMNTTRIEEIGLTHVEAMLRQMGGWPVLEGDAWDEANFTWEDATYKLKDLGFEFNYMFSFSVDTHLKNSSRRVIQLGRAELGLGRDYLVQGADDRQVAALYSYMRDVAVLMGADKDRATSELKESLEFVVQLARIESVFRQTYLTRDESRRFNELYSPMSVRELQDRYPSVPWLDYFRRILPKSVAVNPDEVVIVTARNYLKELGELLSKTPKRVQANYMLWRAVASAVPSLTEALRDRQLRYDTALQGKANAVPRWRTCVKRCKSSLSLAVGSLYVKRLFKEDTKKKVMDIVENIRQQMYKVLEQADWMDERTRKNALDKARAMTSHIAYPEEILDSKKLEEYYSKLEISNSNYLESVLNLTKFELEYMLGLLREPVNKSDWRTHGSNTVVVNAYYNTKLNAINVPAGELKAVFSHDRPNYMNYGAIGMVIGHEITHGFDDTGSQYDKDGNLVDWWEPKTKEAYLKKAACIIQQYGNYTAEQVGMKLNGVKTEGENIADNGGVKQAYHAYNDWARRHGEEQRLPGLERFTPRQMFWISAANTRCCKYRPEKLKAKITTDEHSPGEFRVLGPISNRDEFAEDFRCPAGSKMNPIKKCQLW